MMQKLIKRLLFVACAVILVWVVIQYIKKADRSSVSILPAKIEEIKQAVKLSTLNITTEEIIRDSINNKGVVMRVKARVYIRFDLENIPMEQRGDTLYVQLPREIIDIYESSDNGYQVLDVWYLPLPEEPATITLTSAEENIVKQRVKHRIEAQMYEKGYVKRARENALHSLAALFSRFHDHVVIQDNSPAPSLQERGTTELPLLP